MNSKTHLRQYVGMSFFLSFFLIYSYFLPPFPSFLPFSLSFPIAQCLKEAGAGRESPENSNESNQHSGKYDPWKKIELIGVN